VFHSLDFLETVVQFTFFTKYRVESRIDNIRQQEQNSQKRIGETRQPQKGTTNRISKTS
jgi:hypothetical protein